jgi:hypothetical protein
MNGEPGFSDAADFAFENLGERDFAVEHLIERITARAARAR